jgi:hypothetical protein
MAAPLVTCTKEEQRSVNRFLISEGVKPIEVHQMASFLITETQEVPDAAICREDYADSLLGRTNKAYSWSTTRLGGTLSPVPRTVFTSLEESSSTCSQIKATWTFD